MNLLADAQSLRASSNPKRPPEPTDAYGFNRNGLYEIAISDYSKAIQIYPGFAEAHYKRSSSFCELNRTAGRGQ